MTRRRLFALFGALITTRRIVPNIAAIGTNAGAIFKQMTAITVNVLTHPDVVHPTNWQTIQLVKDGSGRYWPGGRPLVPTLWGLPVIVTPTN